MNGDETPENDHVAGDVRYSLADNLHLIKEKTGNSSDIVIRRLKTGAESKVETAIVYVGGIADEKTIHEFLIESITNSEKLMIKRQDRKSSIVFPPTPFHWAV